MSYYRPIAHQIQPQRGDSMVVYIMLHKVFKSRIAATHQGFHPLGVFKKLCQKQD